MKVRVGKLISPSALDGENRRSVRKEKWCPWQTASVDRGLDVCDGYSRLQGTDTGCGLQVTAANGTLQNAFAAVVTGVYGIEGVDIGIGCSAGHGVDLGKAAQCRQVYSCSHLYWGQCQVYFSNAFIAAASLLSDSSRSPYRAGTPALRRCRPRTNNRRIAAAV